MVVSAAWVSWALVVVVAWVLVVVVVVVAAGADLLKK